MFCGDETGGLVVDIGAYNSRFGFSGEDTPKSVFNSVRGRLKVLNTQPCRALTGGNSTTPARNDPP